MAVKARIQHVEQYISDLRQQIGYYIGYVPTWYADEAAAAQFYEVLKNDPAVSHAMHLLSLMVAGEYVELDCKDPVAKRIFELVLNSIEDFTHVRKSLTYGAILFGLGVQKKYWKRTVWQEWPELVWEVPVRIREIDRRRMRIERDGQDKNDCYWTLWDPHYDFYVRLEDRAIEPNAEIAVQDFIWYFHEYEELNPYGRGLGDSLFHLAYIKSKVIQYWADLCESWAKPFMIALVDSAKAMINSVQGQGFTTHVSLVNDLLDKFEKARARHMVVMDKSNSIDFHEAGSTGNNILNDLMNYADNKIQLLILGAELTTSAPSVGSYALGQIHRGATQSIIQYNRLRLQEVLERDLLWDFYARNKKNFSEFGLKVREGSVRLKIKTMAEEEMRKDPSQMQKIMGQ